MWGAVVESITRQLLPPRALAALKSFRDLIEDGQAMLAGTYVERLEESVQESSAGGPPAVERASSPASRAENDDTDFDPGNFSFDFAAGGAAEDEPTGENAPLSTDGLTDLSTHAVTGEAVDGFRAPGAAANTAELLKFLIDRTGYIKLLEEEDTPESYSRIENLRELVNAAMDSRDRGETLDQFLDHAALVSDADQYDEHAQITLMTLHAAKGLEFRLVVLAGMEEGLFPHSRTMLEPDAIEEERRLCYVGMTRAMDTLILSRAVYRRRYGTDMPEASVPSRFLEEVPRPLVEELGGSRRRASSASGASLTFSSSVGSSRTRVSAPHGQEPHYSYEDEDQSATWNPARVKAKSADSAAELQLDRQYRRIFCVARQEVQRSEISAGGTDGQARIPSGAEGQASEIWRRNGVSARRRWGRRQDYGTIPSLRFEEIGGEVRAVGEGVSCGPASKGAISRAGGIAEAVP